MAENSNGGKIWIPLICVVMGALLSSIATIALTKNEPPPPDRFLTMGQYNEFIKSDDGMKAAMEKEISGLRADIARLQGRLDQALAPPREKK